MAVPTFAPLSLFQLGTLKRSELDVRFSFPVRLGLKGKILMGKVTTHWHTVPSQSGFLSGSLSFVKCQPGALWPAAAPHTVRPVMESRACICDMWAAFKACVRASCLCVGCEKVRTHLVPVCPLSLSRAGRKNAGSHHCCHC